MVYEKINSEHFKKTTLYALDRNSEGPLCSSTFVFGFLGHFFSSKFQSICPGEFFCHFWKKRISGNIKLPQIWYKNLNPQNFRRHSYPKVVSNQLYFSKFQNLFFSYLVPKFSKFWKFIILENEARKKYFDYRQYCDMWV